jgi:hypothetical protein
MLAWHAEQRAEQLQLVRPWVQQPLIRQVATRQ